MKVFIVAALLVAAVAGQSLDMYKTLNKDLSITSKKGLTFGNQRYPYNYYYGGDYDYTNMINNHGDYSLPSTHYYGGDEDYTVLSYEEIMSHPLFREYMSLPLFRQYWSYPMFQKYVCSHYFQQYWTMPAFQQYFVQPTLFYRFIFPIVQLFKYESTTMNTYTGGDFWNKNAYPVGDYYQQGHEQQYYNHGRIPSICYTNAMYCRALVQKMYNHLMYNKMVTPEISTMDTTSDLYKYNPYYARMMYPTQYNKQYYPTIYNKEMYPTVYNKEMYPTVYDKEMYPTVYDKEMYPTIYNKEMYPTVYNKEFQRYEVPSKTVQDEIVRPFLAKTMFQDKTFGEQQKFVPEQIIRA